MRIDTPEVDLDMHADLVGALDNVRFLREFNPEKYLGSKVALINKYFSTYGLSSAVVALSGGIDSSVVAGILRSCANVEGSPIKHLLGVFLPVYDKTAATGQGEATARGEEVATHFGVSPLLIDITKAHDLLCETVDRAFGATGASWARGQAVAYQRTPALYYVTSLLTERGTPGVLCGTTNLDEGGYLGYFGKASDGLVDLQLIGDLHKSEVYALARHLGVPTGAVDVTPAGDMYDGRSDVEVFGTSYDFVELFLELKRKNKTMNYMLRDGWSRAAQEQFAELSARLERLHDFNGHKYLGASPAVHLDVLAAKIPGGWKYETWNPKEGI